MGHAITEHDDIQVKKALVFKNEIKNFQIYCTKKKMNFFTFFNQYF